MPFTNEEAFDMLAVYFECLQNATIAEREYAFRYPARRHHSRNVFKRLAKRLKETGHVQPIAAPNRDRRARNAVNIINVLAYTTADPHLSIRDLVRDLGLSYSSIQRILKDHKWHPYHVILHQELKPADFDHRLDFCYWLLGMVNENRNFLSQILWTDEATFSSSGKVNTHNMHYWSETNPHWLREVQFQNRWSVNVWCGILGGRIIGPYIFDQHLNGATYLQFLEDELPILLEDIPLEDRMNMWFQQDGCPAHYARNVQNFLNRQFPDKWIGRNSIFPWPARSPDLTVLDFYLWGKLKDIVYKDRPTTPDDMKDRIREAIRNISVAEIEVSVLSTTERLNLCVANNGGQFEHLKR